MYQLALITFALLAWYWRTVCSVGLLVNAENEWYTGAYQVICTPAATDNRLIAGIMYCRLYALLV